jgi:glycosyltransferase involved in cell wall biosynthesis
MCSTAAHLTDRVFPDVPIRQWVLSVPFELRLLLARNAAALSAVGRIFVREIWRWQREQFVASLMQGRRGEASPPPSIRSGAVCFPQRFGGSLNLNVHYHVAVPDGVFSREPEAAQSAVFHQLAIPNRSDLETIGHAVELRVLRWLRRGGLLDADEAQPAEQDAERQRDALDACLRGSSLQHRSVADLYRAADVVVQPSHGEGLGLALLEAMACGRPVVGTAVTGIAEIITHGIHGLLVQNGDIAAMADAIVQCLTDKPLAAALSAAARQRVLQNFSRASMLDGTIAVYDTVNRQRRIADS